ncbi:MAG: exodeoxyribonuclease V subunit beta [Pseudomonadota bacterium]
MKPFELTQVPLTGWNLLEANAGTGKTYSICGLYLRMMLELDCGHDQLLTITFTRAAVAELKTRLLGTLIDARRWLTQPQDEPWPEDDPLATICRPFRGDAACLERITRALASFDLAPVLTIHSFCQQLLTEASFATGFDPDAELLELTEPVVEELTEQAWRSESEKLSPAVLSQVAEVQVPELTRQITGLFNRPYARREYQAVDNEALTRSVDDLEQARAVVRAAYAQDGERAVELIQEAKLAGQMRKDRYSDAHIREARQALIQCLNGLAIKPNTALRRLSAKFVEGAALKAYKPGPQHPLFAAVGELEQAAEALKEAATQYRASLAPRLEPVVGEAFAAWKTARGQVTFDDLIQKLLSSLRDPQRESTIREECAKRFRGVLVDEYQDTDPLQGEIFRRLFREGSQPVWQVGDPKQALYAFRGADLHAYLKAREQSDARYSLTTDWRAHPDLVAAINALHRQREAPFVLPELQFLPAVPAGAKPGLQLKLAGVREPALTAWDAGQTDAASAALQCARLIGRLLTAADAGEAWLEAGDERRPLRVEDIVVLVRKHKHGELMARALEAQGVRCVRPGVGSVFATAQAQELEQLLHGVCHLERPGRMAGAMATDLLGVAPQELHELTRDEELQDRWRDRFRDWRQIWAEQGIEALLVAVLRDTRAADRLLTRDEGTAWLARWFHLIELLGAAAGEARLSIFEQLALLNAHRLNTEFNEAHQVRLDTAQNAVRVLTYHVAKGLQFPLVVCPFLWDATERSAGEASYHDPEGNLVIAFGAQSGEMSRTYARAESVSENARLSYVALTRAQACCYFPWQSVAASRWSGLRQLINPPLDYAKGEYRDGLKGAAGDVAHTADDLATLKTAGVHVLDEPPVPVAPLVRDLTPGQHRRPQPVAARWSVSSYSSLFGGAASARDMDQVVPLDEEPGVTSGWTMHHLPPGTTTGLMVHELLEKLPATADGEASTASDAAALAEFAAPYLARYGLDHRFAPALGQSLEQLFRTPLGPEALRLETVSEDRRVVEMEFHLPVRGLIVNRFWRALRSEAPPSGLAATVEGFLRGFIDLVVEQGGRYWIIDYKSNFLGPGTGSYASPALADNVQHHRYDLQYHLYTVALHQFLTQQKPAYAYEQHFGGVLYVYLRGLDEPDHGVHFARPDEMTTEQLSALIFK